MPRKEPSGAPLSAKDQQDMLTDGIENYELPKSVVTKIAKSALPDNAKLQKETVLALVKGSTVFINYLAATAHDIATSRQHKSISAADIFNALEMIDFGHLAPLLEEQHQAWQSQSKTEKGKKASASAASASASAATNGNTSISTSRPTASSSTKPTTTTTSTSTSTTATTTNGTIKIVPNGNPYPNIANTNNSASSASRPSNPYPSISNAAAASKESPFTNEPLALRTGGGGESAAAEGEGEEEDGGDGGVPMDVDEEVEDDGERTE
ncbi:hypothetical protein D9756_010613 [Leucocoprinus leucothites]|uniref:DNA polymerase epsilon subunit D n=1 Tax=Leucocoprinus leucothites TaxID=201217 RepID=A0A8H5FRX3_9AGAR|nr:hypothetical protein D9756_010613 [Leucoagaricus leucothites]